MVRSRMMWLPLATLAALTTLVSADVEFTSPKAGAEVPAGTVTVEWKDSGDSPALDELTTYDLTLWAGGNESPVQMLVVTQQGAVPFTSTGNKAIATVGKAIGGSTPKNSYFFKMISTSSKGGTVTNFSPRFTLTGMTAEMPQAVIDGMKTVKGTDGPDRIDTTGDAAEDDPADGDYDVEYTMQTGLTRYAPMQPVPPTKIVKKETTPLYPTSGFNIAKTFLPIPKVQTTITQSQTFSVSSRENTVAAAPTDDMAKFLNRWKD